MLKKIIIKPEYNFNLTFEGIDFKKEYYKLTPIDGSTDDEIKYIIKSKWRAVTKSDNVYVDGNNNVNFFLTNEGVIFNSKGINEINDINKFYKCISSPLLLYRCSCIFPKETTIVSNDKFIWTCELIHKKTLYPLSLYEWKGCPTIGISSINPINEYFIKDILELLSYILSDQCSHPYGIVSGTIA